jgi:hypothetical protein
MPGHDDVLENLLQIPTAKPTKKTSSTETRVVSTRMTKKVTKKAAAAGQAQMERVVEEIIEEDEHAIPIAEKQKSNPAARAGSTRSGLRYLKE